MDVSKWMVFTLLDQQFAVPAPSVLELVKPNGIHPLSISPPNFVGLMRLREDVFPVLDLRRQFGFKDKEQEIAELCETLDAREQDHRNWLNELRSSVVEKREFRLTTDPHKCAFGRWYDAFRSDSMAVRLLLRRFDSPHKAIHRLGVTVRKLADGGALDEALELIRRTWEGDLRRLVELFAEAKRLLHDERGGTVLVVAEKTRKLGLLVDDVREIADVDATGWSSTQDLDLPVASDDVLGVAKIQDRMTVMLRVPTTS